MVEHKLGYVLNQEDKHYLTKSPQDWIAKLRSQTFKRPKEINFRKILKVENQGNMGSCVGHGTTSAMEAVGWLQNQQLRRLSRMHGYLGAQKYSGDNGLLGRDEGATISGSLKNILRNGVADEKYFEYPNPVKYSTDIPEEARQHAIENVIRNHVPIRSYDDVMDFLGAGQGSIFLGMSWPKHMGSTGEYLRDFNPTRNDGGHCVCWPGYSKETDSNGNNLIEKFNSHGKRWGDNGWAKMTRRVVNKILGHQWTEAYGITTLTEPKPAKIDWSSTCP